jgi:hypothetical protein
MARTWAIALATALSAGCSDSGSPTAAAGASGGAAASDVSGQFSGTYKVSDCTESGLFAGSCEASGLVGQSLPIVLALSQNFSTVTGSVTLGSLSGNFNGRVSGSTLTGSAALNDITDQGVAVSTAIQNWNTTIAGNAMTGGFDIVLRVANSPGDATLKARVEGLTR